MFSHYHLPTRVSRTRADRAEDDGAESARPTPAEDECGT
jgi:hypothetical protein